MVSLRYVHHFHYLFDRHALVGVDGEGRVLFRGQFLYELVFHRVEGYGSLLSVNVVGVDVFSTVLYDTVAFALTCPVLLGSRSFSALGLTSVEVTRKNISSRNTMSVIEDIDIFGSAFVFLLKAIITRLLFQFVLRKSR